ncbi:RICIN domain-containing protein [Streptomyces sp. DH8]|uniref:RICIN domain-containing protein n=1 Tax=Streptomyces sp. DH8 TaxID=2857008 RepID=UPI001E41E645|nr:RICIN domain-containing protein [Streptomyces sp. DH8]
MRGKHALLLGGVITLASLVAPPGAVASEGDSRATPRTAVATQTFRNQATGRCLDDTNNGFRTWSCNGTNPQLWDVRVWGDGTRQLRNVNTQRCIEDSHAHGLRTVGSCSSAAEQSWWIKVWDDGTVRFQNQATLRCIDDSSLGLRTFACNNLEFQSWS